MEIASFLHLTTRRVVALVLAAGLAAAATALVLYSRPADYQASAVVFVGQALKPGDSSYNIDPLVADFQSALGLDAVAKQVARDAHVGPNATSGITSNPANGSGGPVDLAYTGSSAEEAQRVLRAAGPAGLEQVASLQVKRAEVNRDAVIQAQNDAYREWNDFQAAHGYNSDFDKPVADAQKAYDDAVAAARDNKGDPSFTKAVQSTRSALDKATEEQTQANALKARIASAGAEINNIESDIITAKAAMSAARSSTYVSITGVSRVSKMTSVIRGSLTTFVVVFGLGLLLLMWGEYRTAKKAKLQADAAPLTSAVPPPPTPEEQAAMSKPAARRAARRAAREQAAGGNGANGAKGGPHDPDDDSAPDDRLPTRSRS